MGTNRDHDDNQAEPADALPRVRDGGATGADITGVRRAAAAQSKLTVVDGICAQLEALDAKLTEQSARLDQVQVKVNLLCDTLGKVQQEQAHAAQLGKQPMHPGIGESSSPTASKVPDGSLGAMPGLSQRAPLRFSQQSAYHTIHGNSFV